MLVLALGAEDVGAGVEVIRAALGLVVVDGEDMKEVLLGGGPVCVEITSPSRVAGQVEVFEGALRNLLALRLIPICFAQH